MSGPKSYTPALTAEQRARLEKEAEERRKQAEFNQILSDFKNNRRDENYFRNIKVETAKSATDERERILSSIANFMSQETNTDFSVYKDERIPSELEFELQKRNEYDVALENYARICAAMNMAMADCFEYEKSRCEELTEQIKAETQRLENLQVEQMQNQLIYTASLDVLSEMGYELIGDNTLTKKSGITVKSTLLRLDNDTAINLTSTSNGQYTFELVGVNNDGHYPTEAEITKLFELMCSKCHVDFATFKSKLAQKGILMNDTNERTPDVSYCRSKKIGDYTNVAQASVVTAECDEMRRLNGKI